MIRLDNLRLDIDAKPRDLVSLVAKTLRVDVRKIKGIDIARRAIDARRGRVNFCYSLDIMIDGDENTIIRRVKNARAVDLIQPLAITQGDEALHVRPVVIGAGPAGLFVALYLSEQGYRPIVLEQGPDVDQRVKAVDAFKAGGRLDPRANICFGEGGAGTFSDGKLTTRIKDVRCRYVLDKLVSCGASSDIRIHAKPHVGTDVLRGVIKNLREEIIRLGGTVRFDTAVDRFIIKDGRIMAVAIEDEIIETQTVVLATGHSARDTYQRLNDLGVTMQAKPFAVGYRIEHPRELIDRARYGQWAGHEKLGAADYNLKVRVGGRQVFTFCMCPGGEVVNSSSELDHLCVNGMSYHSRNGRNSNAAIVCSVTPEQLGYEHAMEGIAFQREIEKRAFDIGGTGYGVPVQRVADFIQGIESSSLGIKPTVQPAAVPTDLSGILPEDVTEAIRQAVPLMDQKIRGFALGDAVLSAVESRTSSPIRILRDENGQSVNVEGLYPAGEGAGYAGGIISAAVDGVRAAQHIMKRYRPQYVGEIS